MDDHIISYVAKFLSQPIIAHIYSNPPYSVEVLIMLTVSTIYFWLILEVNRLFKELDLTSRIKIEQQDMRLQITPSGASCCTDVSVGEAYGGAYRLKEHRSLFSTLRKNMKKKNFSTHSSNDWTVHQMFANPMFTPVYTRTDQILAITPDEYVKRERLKRLQVAQIQDCIIKSLTEINAGKSGDKTSEDQRNLELMQDYLRVLSSSNPIRTTLRENECINQTLYDLIESIVMNKKLETYGDGDNLGKGDEEMDSCSSLSEATETVTR